MLRPWLKPCATILTAIALTAVGIAGHAGLASGAPWHLDQRRGTTAPCATAFPNAHSTSKGGTFWWNRQESVRRVLCAGFGLDPSADFPISAGMVCGMLAQVIGKTAHNLGTFTGGACSGAELASAPKEPARYIGVACGWASDLLGVLVKPLGVAASLGCTLAPSAGTSLGALFESKHELDVAVDVVRHGKCIKYSPSHFGSPWIAVKCKPRDLGFSDPPRSPTGSSGAGVTGTATGDGGGPDGGGGTPGDGNEVTGFSWASGTVQGVGLDSSNCAYPSWSADGAHLGCDSGQTVEIWTPSPQTLDSVPVSGYPGPFDNVGWAAKAPVFMTTTEDPNSLITWDEAGGFDQWPGGSPLTRARAISADGDYIYGPANLAVDPPPSAEPYGLYFLSRLTGATSIIDVDEQHCSFWPEDEARWSPLGHELLTPVQETCGFDNPVGGYEIIDAKTGARTPLSTANCQDACRPIAPGPSESPYSPNGKYAVLAGRSTSDHGEFVIDNSETGEVAFNVEGPWEADGSRVEWSPDSRYVVFAPLGKHSSSESELIRVDLATSSSETIASEVANAEVRPDASAAFWHGTDDKFHYWSAGTNNTVVDDAIAQTVPNLGRLAWRPGSDEVAFVGSDNRTYLASFPNGQPKEILPEYGEMEWSHDGRFLAISGVCMGIGFPTVGNAQFAVWAGGTLAVPFTSNTAVGCGGIWAPNSDTLLFENGAYSTWTWNGP